MKELIELIESINDSKQLQDLLEQSSKLCETNCDNNATVMHEHCFHSSDKSHNSKLPRCSKAFIYLVLEILALKPNLMDDNIKKQISDYFKTNNIKANGLISRETLNLLGSSSTRSPRTTWLKFETLLIHLIKDHIYEPKTMSNEVLKTVKEDLDSQLAARFSSILNGCVKYCREINKSQASQDEEEEEKWCEIIDWMSWFLASDDMGDI